MRDQFAQHGELAQSMLEEKPARSSCTALAGNTCGRLQSFQPHFNVRRNSLYSLCTFEALFLNTIILAM